MIIAGIPVSAVFETPLSLVSVYALRPYLIAAITDKRQAKAKAASMTMIKTSVAPMSKLAHGGMSGSGDCKS